MADGVIDLKRQSRELKASEHLAGFAGFLLDLGPAGPPKDGLLKIADFTRRDGSGYLTLTFQADADPEPARREALTAVFSRFVRLAAAADAATGTARYGRGFEAIMIVSEGFLDGDAWFVVEANIYYRELGDRVRDLVEQSVLPGLAAAMPITFDPVNWWRESTGGDAANPR